MLSNGTRMRLAAAAAGAEQLGAEHILPAVRGDLLLDRAARCEMDPTHRGSDAGPSIPPQHPCHIHLQRPSRDVYKRQVFMNAFEEVVSRAHPA